MQLDSITRLLLSSSFRLEMSLFSKQRTRPPISSLFIDTIPKHGTLPRGLHPTSSSPSLDHIGTNDGEVEEPEERSYPSASIIPHEGFANNEEWVGAQKAILTIFQGKKFSPDEQCALCKLIRRLAQSELGPFIYDYYRNQLMPRGMRVLRQDILSNPDGHIKGLEVTWNCFYKEILSDLKVALYPVMIKEHNIRQLTLLGFRDFVLLKTDIESVFHKTADLKVSPAIEQMLLVLQSVRISNPPSENYIRLERLVGRVIVPYLGYLGLYDGGSEPVIRSENYGTVLQRAKKVTDEISLSRAPSLYPKRRPRQNSNKPLTLETVSEMTQRERDLLSATVDGRRYSCDILM